MQDAATSLPLSYHDEGEKLHTTRPEPRHIYNNSRYTKNVSSVHESIKARTTTNINIKDVEKLKYWLSMQFNDTGDKQKKERVSRP